MVGIPLQAPGFYVVELASPRLGAALLDKTEPMYVPAGALVTNLSVHLKWGRENALVWVTTLDDAAAGRRRARRRAATATARCSRSGADRRATASRASPGCPTRSTSPRCYRSERFEGFDGLDYRDYYAARGARRARRRPVRHRADRRRPQLRALELGRGHRAVALPAAVASAGRRRSSAHTDPRPHAVPRRRDGAHEARPAPRDDGGLRPRRRPTQRPTAPSIRHLGSDETLRAAARPGTPPAAPSRRGRSRAAAKLGPVRRRRCTAAPQPASASARGSFRVEEFRVPLMRRRVQLPAEPQVGVDGGAGRRRRAVPRRRRRGRLPVVAARADPRPRAARAATTSSTSPSPTARCGKASCARATRRSRSRPARRSRACISARSSTLDAAGTARARDHRPAARSTRGASCSPSSSTAIPNGEVQTVAATRAAVAGGAGCPASKPSTGRRERTSAQGHASSCSTSPASRSPARRCGSTSSSADVYSHRKRLVGGFYAYEHGEEIAPRRRALRRHDRRARPARVRRRAAAPTATLILQATVTDAERPHARRRRTTSGCARRRASGGSRVDDSDRMDVLPEKRALRARRDGALPGAHAVPRGDRAGHRRARRRRSTRVSCTLSGNEPGGRGAGATATTRRTCSSRCWRCAGASATCSRRRWSISASRRSSSASPRSDVGWRAHELERRASTPDRAGLPVREKARGDDRGAHAPTAAPPPRGQRGRARRGRRGPARAAAEQRAGTCSTR